MFPIPDLDTLTDIGCSWIVGKVVEEALERMPLFCQNLAQGRYPVC